MNKIVYVQLPSLQGTKQSPEKKTGLHVIWGDCFAKLRNAANDEPSHNNL